MILKFDIDKELVMEHDCEGCSRYSADFEKECLLCGYSANELKDIDLLVSSYNECFKEFGILDPSITNKSAYLEVSSIKLETGSKDQIILTDVNSTGEIRKLAEITGDTVKVVFQIDELDADEIEDEVEYDIEDTWEEEEY